ncbi:MAG TPA: dienelactone hydrolase family protein [Candidatus Polarisedimenticolia bacterium]|nr:dienelactone hydrolase family protein [Candidatus Polarisedimenticolia bacterium]
MFVRALGVGVLVSGAAVQAYAGTPIKEGKLVSLQVRGEPVKAYVSQPLKAGTFPGVVVVHEWWGLNAQIKGVADRAAEDGYVVIAPDLYRGKLGTDAGIAHELMRGLNENYALDVVEQAILWLRASEAGTVKRAPGQEMPVGVLGFCMGGRIALATALKPADIQSIAMFYGSVETQRDALKPLHVPLLGIFGNEDHGIPLDQIKAFEAALKESGKQATVLVYPGVGHAFFNEERPGYDKEVAFDAWERTRMFLKETLVDLPAQPPKKPTKERPKLNED